MATTEEWIVALRIVQLKILKTRCEDKEVTTDSFTKLLSDVMHSSPDVDWVWQLSDTSLFDHCESYYEAQRACDHIIHFFGAGLNVSEVVEKRRTLMDTIADLLQAICIDQLEDMMTWNGIEVLGVNLNSEGQWRVWTLNENGEEMNVEVLT